MQRIVAGELKGRRLRGLPSALEGVRPSSARVRSAIFDRLQREVVGARVLDLFAGSGALAIEALSRGAAQATLVEIRPDLARFVQRQLADLSLEGRARVWQGDARGFLSRPATALFDLVLIDPPYADLDVYREVLETLTGSPWLAPDAVIVVEHERERSGAPPFAWPSGIVVEARRDHGSTVLEFLRTRGADGE